MAQVKEPLLETISYDKDPTFQKVEGIADLITAYMNNYEKFERNDRLVLLRIIKYLTLPRWDINEKAPIEEEFLQNKK